MENEMNDTAHQARPHHRGFLRHRRGLRGRLARRGHDLILVARNRDRSINFQSV